MNILYLSLKIHKGVVFVERLYPRFIVIHHTAGFDVPALTIDGYHAKQGFGVKITSPKPLVKEYIRRGFRRTDGGVIVCIGYHYLIRTDGSVEKGRPDFIRGAHCVADNMNFKSIGVALTGNFCSKDNPRGEKGLTRPSKAQVTSLKELVHHLMEIYQIPRENVLGHKNVKNAATSCPGDRFVFEL